MQTQARICPICYDDHEASKECGAADLITAIKIDREKAETQLRSLSGHEFVDKAEFHLSEAFILWMLAIIAKIAAPDETLFNVSLFALALISFVLSMLERRSAHYLSKKMSRIFEEKME